MPFWRRKRAKRFKPFDRSALPEVTPPTFDEMLAEGLLVAEAAGRMALRNRFVMHALRGDEPFDNDRAAAAARADRLRDLLGDLQRDLREAESERERRSEAADPFRGYVG